MKILFIGYSTVVRKRILPYLNEIKGLSSVEIARFHTQKEEKVTDLSLPFAVYDSYEKAFEKSDAEIAYISTVNKAHDFWARKAVESGRHVIVDKPAFSDLKNTYDIINLSNKHNLCIAESTVYTHHSQITKALEIIGSESLFPSNITVNFAFPQLNPDNFRYKRSLGGGALNDLGPYVVSAGRIFFNEQPEAAVCNIKTFSDLNYPDNVETSFDVLLKYSKGRSLIGQFGFNSEYINRINVSGENFYIEINRVFTPPCDINNEITFKMNNKIKLVQTGISNSFVNFIQSFITAIINKDYNKFSDALLEDAKTLDLIKRNT